MPLTGRCRHPSTKLTVRFINRYPIGCPIIFYNRWIWQVGSQTECEIVILQRKTEKKEQKIRLNVRQIGWCIAFDMEKSWEIWWLPAHKRGHPIDMCVCWQQAMSLNINRAASSSARTQNDTNKPKWHISIAIECDRWRYAQTFPILICIYQWLWLDTFLLWGHWTWPLFIVTVKWPFVCLSEYSDPSIWDKPNEILCL